MKKTTPTTLFVKRARAIHKNVYDYSNTYYVNVHTKVEIVCKKHGSFFQTPDKHVNRGTRCPACAGRPIITTKVFINRAQSVHGNRYNYSRAHYVNDTTKVEILCKRHGSFFQSPGHHFHKKQGCPKCKHEQAARRGVGGYSENTIGPKVCGTFYCVELSNSYERYIKVGITKTSIVRRLTGCGLNIKILYQQQGKLLHLYKMEQRLLVQLKHYRYKIRPQNKHARKGWTECFPWKNKALLLGKIKEL